MKMCARVETTILVSINVIIEIRKNETQQLTNIILTDKVLAPIERDAAHKNRNLFRCSTPFLIVALDGLVSFVTVDRI